MDYDDTVIETFKILFEKSNTDLQAKHIIEKIVESYEENASH